MKTLITDFKVEPIPVQLFRTGQKNRPQRICIWRRYEVEQFEELRLRWQALKNAEWLSVLGPHQTAKEEIQPVNREEVKYLPNCSQHEHMSEDRVFFEIGMNPMWVRPDGEGREKAHYEAQWLVEKYPTPADYNSRVNRIRKNAGRIKHSLYDKYGDQCSILVMNEVTEMVIRKSACYDVHQLARY